MEVEENKMLELSQETAMVMEVAALIIANPKQRVVMVAVNRKKGEHLRRRVVEMVKDFMGVEYNMYYKDIEELVTNLIEISVLQ